MAPRRSNSQTSTHPSNSVESTKPYAHLSTHTTHIPASRILKTWRPLPSTTQDRIKSLLLSVKHDSKARRRKPAFKTLSKKAVTDALSDEDWEIVVDEVVEKLVKKLPRMPFPAVYSKKKSTKGGKGASAEDFNLETLLGRNAGLKATSSSNLGSAKLLRAQIRREERALKRDREELKGLQEGVRRASEGNGQRGLHEVVGRMDRQEEKRMQNGERGREGMDEEEDIIGVLQPTQATRPSRGGKVVLMIEDVENDPELAPLVKQLRSHLMSMRGNVAGLKDMRTELGRAEDALRLFDSAVLSK
jgi:kinetochore protein Fta7